MTRRLGVLAVGAASVGWGSLTVSSAAALRHVGPLTLLAAEVGVAAVVLLVICRLLGRRLPRPTLSLASLSLLEPILAFLAFNYGLRFTSSSHAGVLLGLESVFAVTLGALVARKVPAASTLAGISLGVVGVVVLTGSPGSAAEPGSAVAGDALVLLDALLGAGYLALASQLVRGLDPVGLTAMQFLLAVPVTLALAAFGWALGVEEVPVEVPALASWLVIVIAVTGIATPFLVYTWGLQHVSLPTAAALVPLTPLAAVGLSGLMAPDSLSPNVFWAVGLIGAGLLFVGRRGGPEPRRSVVSAPPGVPDLRS